MKEHVTVTDIARWKQSTLLSRLNFKTDIDIFLSKVRIILQVSDFNTCILQEPIVVLAKGKDSCNNMLAWYILRSFV